MNQKFQHLKLQKFACGNQQRIFKVTDRPVFVATTYTETVANVSQTQPTRKHIFFGQYNTEKSITSNANNNKILSGNLINFHDIDGDYIANRGNKLNNFTNYIDQSINPWFNEQINNAIADKEKNKQQRIKYFPEYIKTPIDITNSVNNSYFLLPISTDKYVNIIQPDKNYFLPNESYFNAALKSSYEQTLEQFYKKPYYYAEDNTIPLYDMNFTFLQTVNLGSSTQVFNWLQKNNLNTKTYIEDNKTYAISSQILFNSETNSVDTVNPDSILIMKLLNIMEKHLYLFGTQQEKNIMQDLIASIDNSSTTRILLPIAQISKLNEQIITSGYAVNPILNQIFKNENIVNSNNQVDIFENFTKIQPEDWSNILIEKDGQQKWTKQLSSTLPQNVILSMDNRYSLLYPKKDTDIPSGYYNIAYLKNNRDPHYNIHYQLPSTDTNIICDYTINMDIPNYISGNTMPDNTPILNSKYDYDLSKSIELNNVNVPGIANKNKIKEILSSAIIQDDINASNQEYKQKYPERIAAKTDHYLNTFKNRHITNNKLYNMGQLYGIRNYLNMKSINNSQQVWLSYKYNTNYDKNFQQEFNEIIELPFKSYSLHRNENWQYDAYGHKIINKVMKYADNLCPWYTQNDMRNFYNINLTEIQKCVGCNLQKSETCSGFCIFPYNKKLSMPKGNIWNINQFFYQYPTSLNATNKFWTAQNNNYNNIDIKECFIIPSSEYNRQLFAESDIYVNDDIQLFVTQNLAETISELEQNETLENISKHFKGIFQGFGKTVKQYNILNQTQINANNQHFLDNYMIAKNSPFNGPHLIAAGTKFTFLNFDTNETVQSIPAGYYTVIRVRSWFSNSIKCEGKINLKPIISTNNALKTQIDKTLEHISTYDFLECIKGFFTAQEQNMSKSNVYSLQLTNSGLNPASDEQVNYYTKFEAAKKLEKDNWTGEPLIYSYLYGDRFYKTKFNENNVPFNYELKTPVSGILSGETISGYINGFEFNPMDIQSYSFDEIIFGNEYNKTDWEIIIIDSETYYYNRQEQKKVQEINLFRTQLRSLLEENIRKLVQRNMPAHTILWQILYSGK